MSVKLRLHLIFELPVQNGGQHDAEPDEIRHSQVEHEAGNELDGRRSIAGHTARIQQD